MNLHEKKPFLHCLRAQIYPDQYAEERIAQTASWCEKYGIQNVILFFNGEEYNVGHITKEQLLPWLEVIKKAKKEFAKKGISTSLNPWFELGHIDRGRTLQPGQHFQTMVDRFGNTCTLVACPLDEEWRSYYLNLMAFYVQEVEPEVLWIEDDFRLHNHDPLSWGGCWCPHHMEAFAKALGKKETREEFVSHLEEKDPSPERKVWLDVSWETMDGLAKDIAKTVKGLHISTSIGLMSSTSFQHAMEARNWVQLHEDLCYDGHKIDRLHLPAYREMGAKSYYFDFNRITMVNRAFLGDDCDIYPELENSSYSDFVKDPKFLSFQLEGALPVGIQGMTYNIFQCAGNGCQEELGYGSIIQGLDSYLNAVHDLDLKPSKMRGIVFPIDEKTVYHRKKQGFLNLIPDDFDAIGYLSSLGYSYVCSKEKKFENQVVALINQNVYNFSDEELRDLFAHNFIYLDGGAVLALQDRGLLSLIHGKEATFRGQAHRYDCFEMLEQGTLHGMHHYRASSQRRAGDYVKIEYEDGIQIPTGLYDPWMKRTGNGIAIGTNFFVYPYVLKGTESTDYFVELRRKMMEQHFLSHVSTPLAYAHHDAVYPYLYAQNEHTYALFLVNANYNDFPSLTISLKEISPKKVAILDHDGSWREAHYELEGETLHLHEKLGYLSTLTLLLEE